MKTKIEIFCADSPVDLSSLSTAVYSELKQTAPLTAEVVFVSKEEIQQLNKTQRNVDKVTDVLSFPTLDGIRGKILNKKDYKLDLTDDGKSIFIGSIAICEERAKEQAVEYGHSVNREITYLLCHGLLHLMGYDHETKSDKTQMRSLEDKIMDTIKVYR